MQAGILYAALESLLRGKDIKTTGPAIFFTVAGLILVLITVLMNINLRFILGNKEGKDNEQEDKGEVSAST